MSTTRATPRRVAGPGVVGMAPGVSSEVRSSKQASASSVHVWPRHQIGWWALGLLLGTCLYPVYFGALENRLHGGALILATAAAGLVSLGLGGLALFVRGDRSVLLFLTFAAAVFLVLLGLMFAVSLVLMGL